MTAGFISTLQSIPGIPNTEIGTTFKLCGSNGGPKFSTPGDEWEALTTLIGIEQLSFVDNPQYLLTFIREDGTMTQDRGTWKFWQNFFTGEVHAFSITVYSRPTSS